MADRSHKAWRLTFRQHQGRHIVITQPGMFEQQEELRIFLHRDISLESVGILFLESNSILILSELDDLWLLTVQM